MCPCQREPTHPGACAECGGERVRLCGPHADMLRGVGRKPVTIVSGTAPHGQGHETAWRNSPPPTRSGVPTASVRVLHSDTARAPRGPGTMGSRSLQVGGSAVLGALRQTLEAARRLAAHLLEADVRDIVVVPRVGLGIAGALGAVLSWPDLARASNDPDRRPPQLPAGLGGNDKFSTPDATYPFGAHLAVVEVEVETGSAALVRYVAVDDAGCIVNPRLATGQIHGGIAQGAAQALLEEIAFDRDGNCETASLVTYGIPTGGASSFQTTLTETLTPRNPLGAKGIGESGAIAATPAVWNAVIDAVRHLGNKHIEMPTTPAHICKRSSALEIPDR
jgi:aerobic carbon-monoxide dehydrogenase large subunit